MLIRFADCTFITVSSQAKDRTVSVYLTYTSLFVKGKAEKENCNSERKSSFIHHVIWFQPYCDWDTFIRRIFYCNT